MHPNLLGTLNVSRHIIDKYRFLRCYSEMLCCQ